MMIQNVFKEKVTFLF